MAKIKKNAAIIHPISRMGEIVKVKVGKGTFWHFQDRFGSKHIPELATNRGHY